MQLARSSIVAIGCQLVKQPRYPDNPGCLRLGQADAACSRAQLVDLYSTLACFNYSPLVVSEDYALIQVQHVTTKQFGEDSSSSSPQQHLADGSHTQPSLGSPALQTPHSNEIVLYYCTGWSQATLHCSVNAGEWQDHDFEQVLSGCIACQRILTFWCHWCDWPQALHQFWLQV